MTLLQDEEWSKWSDRVIAEKCASATLSSDNFRAELSTVDGSHPLATVSADGKTRRRKAVSVTTSVPVAGSPSRDQHEDVSLSDATPDTTPLNQWKTKTISR